METRYTQYARLFRLAKERKYAEKKRQEARLEATPPKRTVIDNVFVMDSRFVEASAAQQLHELALEMEDEMTVLVVKAPISMLRESFGLLDRIESNFGPSSSTRISVPLPPPPSPSAWYDFVATAVHGFKAGSTTSEQYELLECSITTNNGPASRATIAKPSSSSSARTRNTDEHPYVDFSTIPSALTNADALASSQRLESAWLKSMTEFMVC